MLKIDTNLIQTILIEFVCLYAFWKHEENLIKFVALIFFCILCSEEHDVEEVDLSTVEMPSLSNNEVRIFILA